MATNTTAAGEGWAPNVIATFDPADQLADALITRCSTKAGAVDGDSPSVIVPYVSTDPTAAVVAEAADITPNEGTLNQITITTDKVAIISRMSRELAGQQGSANRIATSMRRAVTTEADDLFLNDTTNGLFELSGIDNAGTLGGATGGDLFAAFDAVAAIEGDGGQATHLLISPTDWAVLCKLPEASGSNKSLLADVHDAAARSLAGVPVIVHGAVTDGTALMLDASEVVSAYGQLQMARSEHAYFGSDAIGIRATWRIGWSVVRKARLQKLTVTAASE